MADNIIGYRKIFKGTALFGGVQIFQVLIALVRGKIVALLLGTEGMGLSGLYVSSLSIFVTIAGLGCNLSAVRYISVLQKDTAEYYKQINITKKIFLYLSFWGFFLTIACAYPLSIFTFENTNHIISYLLLSVYVFFSLYNQGLTAILQAMQELKVIASGSVIPSFAVLIISIPVYYFFKLDAIVPMLVIMPFVGTCYLFVAVLKKLKGNELANIIPTKYEFRCAFKRFVGLGIMTVFAVLFGNIASYIISAFISRTGSIFDLGLYNAGISITNQYMGLIFSAMAVDYFPRLITVCNDTTKMNETINYQGEILMLLGLPLLSIMMLTAPICIKILLSEEFLAVNDFIRIVSYGMIFKIASYCLGYVSFAKGDKKTYFFLEGVFGNFLTLMLNCFGYYFMGLKGVAVSFCINYFIYLCVILFYTKKVYAFLISDDFRSLIFISSISLTLLLLLLVFMPEGFMSIVFGGIITFIICFCSLKELDRRIQIFEIIKNKIKKNNA
jgi:O-antigen/teichoic acid export membrane protein